MKTFLDIAYYNNYGENVNLDKYEGYIPKDREPLYLSSQMTYKIKNSFKEENIYGNKRTAEGEFYNTTEIEEYYGSYNGSYAIRITNKNYSIPSYVRYIKVADLIFAYPVESITIFVLEY